MDGLGEGLLRPVIWQKQGRDQCCIVCQHYANSVRIAFQMFMSAYVTIAGLI